MLRQYYFISNTTTSGNKINRLDYILINNSIDIKDDKDIGDIHTINKIL